MSPCAVRGSECGSRARSRCGRFASRVTRDLLPSNPRSQTVPAKTILVALTALAGAVTAAAIGSRNPSAATTSARANERAVGSAAPAAAAISRPRVVVHKDPNCGCCQKWVDHLRVNGFDVVSDHRSNVDSVKKALGVPTALAACHTAKVGGYVIEGHVPADLVKRLLRERPKIVGLAVPGMPAGSPGMEVGHKEPYEIIAFRKNGATSVFARR